MMDIFNLPKTEILIKILRNFIIFFLRKKNIIMLMGDKGVFLCALVNNKIIDSLFVSSEDQSNIDSYKEFFNKFKKFNISLLLNGSECELHHELVPILGSIVKSKPVKNFIQENFAKDDIVAHYVYDVQTSPSEVWNTLIASTPYKPNLGKLVEYLLSNKSKKFKGIYFLALEFRVIIDKIIEDTEDGKYTEYLQIFICVLAIEGIKLIVKHRGNIIAIRRFDYPLDKSELYIQGVLEQEVSDCLIASRIYIDNLNLKVCIIFVVDDNLKSLLEKSSFNQHQIIYKSSNSLLDDRSISQLLYAQGSEEGGQSKPIEQKVTSPTANSLANLPVEVDFSNISNKKHPNSRFSDYLIIKLFNAQKSFSASNEYLESIHKINLISSLIFKPLIALMIILICGAAIIKIKTLENYKKLAILYSQYLSTEQDYYNSKQQYPYIQNATNLADLYVFEALLQVPTPTPFDLFEKLLTNLSSNFHLEWINWQMVNLDKILLSSGQSIEIAILLKFISNNMSLEDSKKLLEQQVTNLAKILNDMDVKFTIISDQILELHNRVIIPVSVTITNKKG
jgi:hypothetical protein